MTYLVPGDPRTDLALRLDPTLLFERMGMVADSWQKDLLFDDAGWWLICCGRQIGKTHGVAALALSTALTRPDSTVIIVTPSERQSVEVLRRVVDFYLATFGAPLPADSVRSLKIELANRSRILALSGAEEKFLRVYANVSLIIADEAARVSDELYHTVSPMLAVSGGRMVLTSTPFYRRGFMHDMWKNGGDDWRRIQVRSDECGRIDPSFLAREKRSKPANIYAQEYEAKWGSTASALFPPDLIEQAMSGEVEPYSPQRPRFA